MRSDIQVVSGHCVCDLQWIRFVWISTVALGLIAIELVVRSVPILQKAESSKRDKPRICSTKTMAWETRHGRQYLYRSYRDDEGRVCKQYLGTGEQAQVNSAFLEAQKKSRRTDQLALLQALREQEELDRCFKEVNKLANKLVKDSLQRAGWHNPKSRGLRRRRKQK